MCAYPSVYSDNILVLDIFFEALNYETIEQKKAYELAGLLGKIRCFLSNRKYADLNRADAFSSKVTVMQALPFL